MHSFALFFRCSFAGHMNFSSDQRERDLINVVEREQCVDARFGHCCLDQLLNVRFKKCSLSRGGVSSKLQAAGF